jgi:hypothetical protein
MSENLCELSAFGLRILICIFWCMSLFQVSGEWGEEALLRLECVYGFLLSFVYFFLNKMAVHLPMMWRCPRQCTGFRYLPLLLFRNNVVDVEIIGRTFEWPTLSAFVLYNHLCFQSVVFDSFSKFVGALGFKHPSVKMYR